MKYVCCFFTMMSHIVAQMCHHDTCHAITTHASSRKHNDDASQSCFKGLSSLDIFMCCLRLHSWHPNPTNVCCLLGLIQQEISGNGPITLHLPIIINNSNNSDIYHSAIHPYIHFLHMSIQLRLLKLMTVIKCSHTKDLEPNAELTAIGVSDVLGWQKFIAPQQPFGCLIWQASMIVHTTSFPWTFCHV